MKKAAFRLLSLTLIFFICSSWGFYGHKKINRYAIFSLPIEMFDFYKRHVEYLSEHAVDPDKRRYVSEGEAVKHYIDIDHFKDSNENVFDSMPRNWNEAVERYSEDTLKTYGILPWNISWMFRELEMAFIQKDPERILSLSSDLGHYIADAHVPLHTTENYNGQLSNQKGIHALWESRIPELLAEDYELLLGKAEYIADPLDMAWTIVEESHSLLDTVLNKERIVSQEVGLNRKYEIVERASVIQRQYSSDFIKLYSSSMDGMVEERMRMAIKRVASFWMTAWVNSGQVKLDELSLGDQSIAKGDSTLVIRIETKPMGRGHEHGSTQ